MPSRKEVLTTGEVARICQVAPRTVSKWFDEGHLKGYRVPGSKDRRIPIEDLIRFMRCHGMPLRGLDTGQTRVLVVTNDDAYAASLVESLSRQASFECTSATSAFGAGMVSADFDPHVIMVDVEMPDLRRVDLWKAVAGHGSPESVKIIALTARPEKVDALKKTGYDACLVRPFEVREAVRVIETLT